MTGGTISRSPGHQKWPQHRVEEEPISRCVQVEALGELIAESTRAIQVREDRQPVRYYIPNEDVRLDKLEESGTTTRCPFKSRARYYNLHLNGGVREDAAWSYDAPYEEHAKLQGCIAFHDELPALRVTLKDASR
ncbi:DUF427 domain-containing protein [Marinimicrobium sp. ABcell2]|uniref:DUF427 domain-containing protein n=1 Tax=Marinimicrobium sp. ABcell2 TaxID=3069751 RepID=UPI0027B4EE7A|nr:DUF427 domain-containing protein [Marinimicrobium sp. ABcell2]MDQ2077778.1 DUF427 domain-containing protein [Marinimicrobium sp. ABcell2]